jgi:uncharacterized protein YkwD
MSILCESNIIKLLGKYMSLKQIRVLLVLFISLYLVSGCATSRRRHKRVYTPRSSTHHVQVAKNMNQLDTYSKNTKPTMIYSYPKTKLPDNVRFVNLKPYKLLVVNEINRVREAQSSGLVAWNPNLAKAAGAHARDMASNNFLGHLGSGKALDFARKAPGQGSNFYERIIFFGYPIRPTQLAGEILTYTKDNIVMSPEPMPHFKHSIENFLKSPAHASILVNNRFTDVGVAAYRADNKIYWVIEFGEAGIGNEKL